MVNEIKRISGLLVSVCFIALAIFSIVYQNAVSTAVISGIERCIYTIIPSLFAMSVISSVIAKSHIFSGISSLIGINAAIVEAFIFSNVGGYPIGAKMLADSVKRGDITAEQAQKALCFCYASGPAFSIGIVGNIIFSSTNMGIALFATVFAVNLTLLIAYALINRCKVKKHYSINALSSIDIVDSVIDSGKSMLSVSAMIVFFAALNAVIESILSYDKLSYFAVVLDITAISETENLSFPVACVLISFGGICVLTQLCAIIRSSFKIKRFCLSFLIRLPLTYIYSLIALKVLDCLGITASIVKLSVSRSIVPLICMVSMLFIAITYKKSAHNS